MQCLELLLCSLQTEASPAAMFARQILAKMEEHVLEVVLGTLAVAHLTIAVPTAKCQVRMFILYLSYINKEVFFVFFCLFVFCLFVCLFVCLFNFALIMCFCDLQYPEIPYIQRKECKLQMFV